MGLGILKKINEQLRRGFQRAFLADPEKMPKRVAILMASVLLLSIVVTYNVLFEREKRKKGEGFFFEMKLIYWFIFLGIQPRSVTDLFRERNAKQRLEHLELQQNIAQARDRVKTTTVDDL
jgi:hypothetical protein